MTKKRSAEEESTMLDFESGQHDPAKGRLMRVVDLMASRFERPQPDLTPAELLELKRRRGGSR
jgi:hypothetical protein